jgi:branched-chain amino acid aminotransferase
MSPQARCIERFVEVEARGGWVPKRRGHALYLRPTLISTQNQLGLGPTEKALFYVIACPVGPYFSSGFAPIKLLATTKYSRAHQGGTGAAKCGGNYGGTILAESEARAQGCAQNLWLSTAADCGAAFLTVEDAAPPNAFLRTPRPYADGDGDGAHPLIAEAGTMNFFVLWRPAAGADLELATPPLDGTILPGITRDTVLALAPALGAELESADLLTPPAEQKDGAAAPSHHHHHHHHHRAIMDHDAGSNGRSRSRGRVLKVVERALSIEDLCRACADGRVVEAFGTGTACVLCPVQGIRYAGRDYAIPVHETAAAAKEGQGTSSKIDSAGEGDGRAGHFTRAMMTRILDIQHGLVDPPRGFHRWSVSVPGRYGTSAAN